MSASTVSATAPATRVAINANEQKPNICRYFLRGICRFGEFCNFSHDLSGGEVLAGNSNEVSTTTSQPSTSKTSFENWANAPIFVPNRQRAQANGADNVAGPLQDFGNAGDTSVATANKSWSEVVSAGLNNYDVIKIPDALNFDQKGPYRWEPTQTNGADNVAGPLQDVRNAGNKPWYMGDLSREEFLKKYEVIKIPNAPNFNQKGPQRRARARESTQANGVDNVAGPLQDVSNADSTPGELPFLGNLSWEEFVKDYEVIKIPDISDQVCPYTSPCPYNIYCMYSLHWELCKMCDQYCLHPIDQAQRRKHNQDCLQQHERDMELSFAIARSKDKTCGICFDTIMEKSGREKRFGILPNCSHIFCLECIRKWRQAKQFEHKITRSCPECRVSSDFVCPSAFWVDTKEDKDKLLNEYRSALGIKDCKYFKKGDGKCPFGNKCFYKHALPNGDLVDVGVPKRTRKVHRDSDELIDLLDTYLWDFVDHRNYYWLEVIGSDDSEDSDWSDE